MIKKEEEESMRRFHRIAMLLVLALFLMGGCSSSFEEEKDAARVEVEKVFQKAPKEANKENEDTRYYLPFGYEIEKETPNNIIFKNGTKTYILFYNLQEDAKSKVVLDATLQQKEFDVKEQFKHGDKLGYLLVKKNSNQLNEVITGIGGVKLTSEVKTNNLKSEAEIMMQIVNSVQFK